MRLLTVQISNIIEKTISDKGIYYANKEYGSDMKICPKLMEETIEKMYEKRYPIFTLKNIDSHNYESYKSCNDITHIDINNLSYIIYALQDSEQAKKFTLYLLEVPDDFCLLTNLSGWRAQMIFESQYNREIVDEDSEWYGTYSIDYVEDESTQALIPFIKQEFIIDSIMYEELIKRFR